MDLLASLGLENALPEHSTRLTHPGVISALENCSGSSKNASDGDGKQTTRQCRLGFNCCLTCGASFSFADGDESNSDGSSNDEKRKEGTRRVTVVCKGCRRAKYCSEVCRRMDAEPSSSPAHQQHRGDRGREKSEIIDNVEYESGACGHSPVICSLLNLCNDDEIAEDNLYNNNNNNQKIEAAKYRIQTEYESYPATLFNMLITDVVTAPWFLENLTRRIRYREEIRSPPSSSRDDDAYTKMIMNEKKRKRRGKRDRKSLSLETTTSGNRKELVLHIVGASSDAELWGWDGTAATTSTRKKNEMLDAYAEASTNVLSYLKNFIDSIDSIRLVFVGPDCPRPILSFGAAAGIYGGGGDNDEDEIIVCRCETTIPGSKTILHIETHCCNYGDDDNRKGHQQQLPPPDAIIFFNPGFSCPDYDWSNALSFAAAGWNQSNTPFIVTTNTEMEGFADIKCLVDGKYVDSKELPTDIVEAVVEEDGDVSSKNKHNSQDDDDDDGDDKQDKQFFFCENPYAGLRVRQSGTMANDLYVKNRWVMGGLLSSQCDDDRGGKKEKVAMKSKMRRESVEEGSPRKKRRKVRSNPALI